MLCDGLVKVPSRDGGGVRIEGREMVGDGGKRAVFHEFGFWLLFVQCTQTLIDSKCHQLQ